MIPQLRMTEALKTPSTTVTPNMSGLTEKKEMMSEDTAYIEELKKRNLTVADGVIKSEPLLIELINAQIQETKRKTILCTILTVGFSLITVACVFLLW